MGAMGVSPSFCCSMARWMMMVVGKKEAAPATASSVIFTQKIGLPGGLGLGLPGGLGLGLPGEVGVGPGCR